MFRMSIVTLKLLGIKLLIISLSAMLVIISWGIQVGTDDRKFNQSIDMNQ